MDELDLVLEDVDEALDGLLLLDEVVAEAGGVDDGEVGRGGVAQPVALVRAGLLRDGATVVETHHLEMADDQTSTLKSRYLIFHVSTKTKIGEKLVSWRVLKYMDLREKQ